MSELPPITQRVQMDTTNYRAGVIALNREIHVIESGFRASAAVLGDWSKSAEGLEMRIKSLGDTIGPQAQKVRGLEQVFKDLTAAGETSDEKLQDLQISINKETEKLNKMNRELGEATTALDEMGKETSAAGDDLDRLADQEKRAELNAKRLDGAMRALGTGLKIGVAAIAGLATAAAAAGAAIGGLVLKSSEMAGELVDASNQTGISVERLQELNFIAGQVGVSTETITGAMAKMVRSMASARGGTGAQAEAFAALGVSVTNADGSLRNSQVVFADAMDALRRVGNETERDALAMAIFGKSAMELNPLIKTSGKELTAMAEEARKLGAVMSEEDVMALEAFGDTLAALKAGLQGTLGTLATAFLPAFQGMADTAKTYLGQFSEIVKGADGDLGKMAEGIGGLLGQIATDIAANAQKMLAGGLSIVQGILDAIVTNLPTLIPAAVSVLTSLTQFLVDNLPIIFQAGADMLLALVDGILPMLPALVDAALKIIVSLANGLTAALPKLLPMIATIIPQIVLVLVENLPLLIDAAIQLILALANGLIEALPILIESIPQIIEALVTALIRGIPMIIVAAFELMQALGRGLLRAIPVLLYAALQVIVALVRAFVKFDWGKLGSDIVNGIRDGFTRQWKTFAATAYADLKRFIANIKSMLGMHSPSKVFAGIGENMSLGLGKGFTGSFANVANQVNQMIGGLGSANLAGGLTPAMAGASAPQGAPVYVTVQANVNNEIDYYRLARRVGEELHRGR